MDVRHRVTESEALRCAGCGTPLPTAILIRVRRDGDPPEPATVVLSQREMTVGRAPECEVPIREEHGSVSRRHAEIAWRGAGLELRDLGSRNGTVVNGRILAGGERARLRNGDRIAFGEVGFIFREVLPRPEGDSAGRLRAFADLAGGLASLEPRVVVERSLAMLLELLRVERGLLIDAGTDPRLRPLLTPLDDPSLELSRGTVRRAFESGDNVVISAGDGDLGEAGGSIHDLGLRRIWVRPLFGTDGRPIAAVYLDSRDAGSWMDAATEEWMDLVADQIGIALRNAALHAEIVALNEGLEAKVVERTRELEDSRETLVAQDRLATLGRLVAAIAHELNNPVGAIASFAHTQGDLLEPVLRAGDAAGALFADREAAAGARRFVEGALEAARRGPLDSRTRRALEERLASWLTARGVAVAPSLAQRFARLGYGETDLEPFAPLLAAEGEALSALAEKVHTFARAATTIRDCAGTVARIVDGLKTYAHLDRAQMEEADLHRGIEATLSVLHSRIPPGIRVETAFADLPPFPHRPGELTQVWTNLVDNAVRSMGESGTLKIETRDLGGDVEVSVEDDGPGIPAELRARIFELHVTTRGPGAGLGLGLPICRRIVESNHGGTIAVESVPGRTVFRVRIPKRFEPRQQIQMEGGPTP